MTRRIRLRRAAPSDSATLFRWRNDSSARRQYLDPSPVTRARHDRWFSSRLRDAGCRMYIAEDGSGRALGQFRLDRRRRTAEISFSVRRRLRGGGIGTYMLRRAVTVARRDLGVRRIVACVRQDNIGSTIAFVKAGYRFSATARRSRQPVYVFVRILD